MSHETTKKKVKFDPVNYNEEIDIDDKEGESDNLYDTEANDLDLDTIKTSRNKSNGLKEFDSEGSEAEEDDENEEAEVVNNFEQSDSESDDVDNFDGSDENEISIEPFNLKQDKEEGTFDSDGFYTRKHDEDADQDRWMSNFTRSDIMKARQAHEERERLIKEAQQKKFSGEKRNARGLYEELIGLLNEEDENDLTIQQVISKLNRQKDSSSSTSTTIRAPLNKNRLKKLAKEEQNQNHSTSRLSVEDKAKLERITEIVDALMDLGNFGVYEETRREICNKLKLK